MTIRRPDGLVEEGRTRSILGAFFDVYNTLGFGFLESVYLAALTVELRRRGHEVALEMSVGVPYKGEVIAWQRVDMLVDNAVIIEIKATPTLAPTAVRQLHNYLRATRIEVGLLLHFGTEPKFYRLYSENDKTSSPRNATEHAGADRGRSQNHPGPLRDEPVPVAERSEKSDASA